jgi:uncharacterized protein
MTPEERNLVTQLFDRLAALEDAPRDPDAERAIRDGLRQAPNAVYALVQTALVQDEALKRADGRIRELEAELGGGAAPQQPGGFLGSMRDALTGRRPGSVPTVRPADAPPIGATPGAPPGYGQPGYAQPMAAAPAGGGGGSFLGTAAAAAAGMIGGSLLLDGIRGMMGHGHGPGHALGGLGPTPASAGTGDAGNPGSNPSGGGGNLARDAGLDDIGRGGRPDPDAGRSQGLVDTDAADAQEDDDDHHEDDDDEDDDDFDNDDDGGDDGDDGGEE